MTRASDPLSRFVRVAKTRLRLFGNANKWTSLCWSIRDGLHTKSSVDAKRGMLLWFALDVPNSPLTPVAERASKAKAMPAKFADFAKAVLVTYFAERPKIGYGAVYGLLAALKSILDELSGQANPRSIALNHFLLAEGKFIKKWDLGEISHATARSKGETLQVLSTIIDGWGLMPRKLGFKTKIPLQRREEVDRHSEPFALRRKRLFPESAVFYFLAELANRKDEIEPRWRLPLREVELQIALGKRVSEILFLPVDSLIEGANSAVGLRYFPEKNADPYVAWVPRDQHFETACEIVKRAIADIKDMTKHARARARELEECSRWQDYPMGSYKRSKWKDAYPFGKLGFGKSDDWMVVSEWADLFSANPFGFREFMKGLGVPVRAFEPINGGEAVVRKRRSKTSGSSPRESVVARLPTVAFIAVRIDELKRALFAKSRELIQIDAPGGKRLRLSEMLFVVPSNWGNNHARIHTGFVRPLGAHEIRRFLTGSRYYNSVFKAFGRSDLSAVSHGFRRWVTTEGRRAGVNNLVLARWMGRTLSQNDVYDYNEPKEFSDRELGISTDLSRVFGPVRDVAEDMASRGIPLVERQTFLAAELKGLIVTDKGGCTHEWAITPCRKSRACYNNCPEFYVIKGRRDHYEKALEEQVLIARALELSKMQIGTAYYANNYVQMQERQLRTVREVIRIHEDSSIPDGTLVQVSPGDKQAAANG